MPDINQPVSFWDLFHPLFPRFPSFVTPFRVGAWVILEPAVLPPQRSLPGPQSEARVGEGSKKKQNMVVRIRLQRLGQRNLPFYRIVVADSRARRDGRFIENVCEGGKHERHISTRSVWF